MKRGLLLLFITFLICTLSVNASESYFLWHNSIDSAYTTSYDGMISNEVGKYQDDTIESLGDKRVKLNNFNAYDVMLYESTTWVINGNNKIDFIEESNDSVITLKGNGTLRLQEIGLGLEDKLSYTTNLLEERIKSYIKGNYILSIEDNYIILKINEIEETKTLSFENKGFNITIKSNSKVPKGTVFIAENKIDDLKEEVSKKLDNEEINYIYDFRLEDNLNTVSPNEEVEVSIKLDKKDYIVYYYNEENELEKIDSSYENDCLKFKTTHFSRYVITSLKEVVTEEEEEPKKDNTLIICISILAISFIVFLSVVLTGKNKNHI